MMKKDWELVVIWWDESKSIYEYYTKEEAEQGGRNMSMALGTGIQWYGVRPTIKRLNRERSGEQ